MLMKTWAGVCECMCMCKYVCVKAWVHRCVQHGVSVCMSGVSVGYASASVNACVSVCERV